MLYLIRYDGNIVRRQRSNPCSGGHCLVSDCQLLISLWPNEGVIPKLCMPHKVQFQMKPKGASFKRNKNLHLMCGCKSKYVVGSGIGCTAHPVLEY
jgi:hypothetical protein